MREYEDEFANTDKRDNGSSFHAGMDMYYKRGEGNLLANWRPREPKVADWVSDATAWSHRHLEPRCQVIHSEVYIAFNFSNGTVHTDSSVLNRAYPAMPGYLPGTTDLVCVLADGRLLVADWKTGGGTGADKQLLTLALGLREVYRAPTGERRKVVLAVLYAGETGVRPHEWEVTDEDLEAHRVAMQFQMADVGVRKDPVPGIHCTQLYCNHLAYCPGITATVEAAAVYPEGLLPARRLVREYGLSEAPTSAQHAGSIMERVTAAKRQLDFYEKRVRAWCDSGEKCVAGDSEYSKQKDGFRWRTKK